MSNAAPVNSTAISAALILCFAIMAMPTRAETPTENPHTPPLPTPLPLPHLPEPIPIPAPPPPSPAERMANLPGMIGSAEMDHSRVIHLHLQMPKQHLAPEQSLHPAVPWFAPQERMGYGELEIEPGDPHYADILHHLGGLKPGEAKPVLPWTPSETWHCAIDPERGDCSLIHRVLD